MNFVSDSYSFLGFQQFNGTPKKPRLSVFCSDKQLYAMLVDDENKKCLFYASTIQRAIRADSDITTEVKFPAFEFWIHFRLILESTSNLFSYQWSGCLQEAARVVGEELVKAAANLQIHEISSYDLNGCAVRGLRGQRIRAFESTISSYGFLP